MTDTKKQRTILIVDDEPGIREVMVIELEAQGFTVLTASNGRAAFDMLGTHSEISAIVSDVRMPNGDGMELLERTMELKKTTGRAVQVVLMTGFSGVTREEAMKRGAADMLLKPFLIDDLLSVISAS